MNLVRRPLDNRYVRAYNRMNLLENLVFLQIPERTADQLFGQSRSLRIAPVLS